MSRQYRSFDPKEQDQHATEVLAVHCLASGPVVSGSLDGELRIWNASSDEARLGTVSGDEVTIDGLHRGIMSISSSSNSGRVLTSDVLGTVALWDVKDDGMLNGEMNLEEDEDDEENTFRHSWRLRMIGSEGTTGHNVLIDGDDGEKVKRKAPICCVTQIHPTKPLFAGTGDWAGVSIYECPNEDESGEELGKSIRYIQSHGQSSRRGASEKKSGAYGQSLTFNAWGDSLAVGSNKGVVSIFDLETGSTMAVLQNHSEAIRALEFTNTGELLVGSDQGSVTMYDIRQRQMGGLQSSQGANNVSGGLDFSYVDTLKGHKTWITSVKVSPDPHYVASSSVNGQVKIWDLRMEPNRSVAVFQTKEEMPVWSLSWKPNAGASLLVTGSGSGYLPRTANNEGKRAAGNVRWYQISGSA